MPMRPMTPPARALAPADRRVLVGAGLGMLAVAALAAALLLWGLARFISAANFPGARLVADHSAFWPGRYPVVRRNSSYLTPAPFSEVYTWYSLTFELGPERYGLGSCNMMADSDTWLRLVDTDTSVTVCDTPAGRMVFVSRSVALRLR